MAPRAKRRMSDSISRGIGVPPNSQMTVRSFGST
jgi:hypothetical protein